MQVFVIYVLSHVTANNTKLDDKSRAYGTVDAEWGSGAKIMVLIEFITLVGIMEIFLWGCVNRVTSLIVLNAIQKVYFNKNKSFRLL